jgi:hypothetical protein
MLRIEARAKILNPKWFEAMLAYGHSGAAEIGKRFTQPRGEEDSSDGGFVSAPRSPRWWWRCPARKARSTCN